MGECRAHEIAKCGIRIQPTVSILSIIPDKFEITVIRTHQEFLGLLCGTIKLFVVL